jgi:hypothetical protein
MIGLLMLAGELFRGARPSRALAKPSWVRELQLYRSPDGRDSQRARTRRSKSLRH